MKKRKSKTAARRSQWRKFSEEFRAKAGNKCAVCGSTERVQAHHLLEKKSHPDLLFEERDLICLCARHHFMTHHGRHYELLAWLERNRPEQFSWLMEQAGKSGVFSA